MKKRILVAGASSGWGHMKAAYNITSALSMTSDVWDADVVDVFDYLPIGLERLTNGGWRFASQYLGAAYSKLYKRWISKAAYRTLGRAFLNLTVRNFESRYPLEEVGVFVATHSAAAAVGALLKRRYQFKLCVAATDFLLHSSHIHPSVDCFYVPPRFELKASKKESEFLKGKTVETGIPIALEFGLSKDKNTLRKELGLSETLPTALVSFGGDGLTAERHIELFERLLRSGFPLQFIVLAGRNVRFARAMHERYRESPYRDRIRVYGYRDDVSDFYSAADIFIGKAGGLSISEAISSGLPMVFVDMLPGQEEFNVKVMTSLGLGRYVGHSFDLMWWKKTLERSANRAENPRSVAFARPRSSLLVANHVAVLANCW